MEGLIKKFFFAPPETLVMKYQIHVRNVKIALGALRQHIMSVVIIIITIKKELCNSIYLFFCSFAFLSFICVLFIIS